MRLPRSEILSRAARDPHSLPRVARPLLVKPTLATVDLAPVLETVAGSLVAGVGITLAFALGLRGLIRASELRADGRGAGAALAATVGALGLLVAIAGVMIGLVIIAGDGAPS
jgi:hypothetical protein